MALKNVQLFKSETLGTGSYGAVCKAQYDQLPCAAKLLYPVLFNIGASSSKKDKDQRQPSQRFEKECQFLSSVSHPHIIQYLGTYRDPETNAPVLLMELMDESLTNFLNLAPEDIPYHIQVNLSYDIAQALAFLHANGIIHRDLSSNNVLLLAGRAKVADFGMSKFITPFATMTACPGTPAYMPPEALASPPVYTEKLDVFSFGVLMVQIMTREFPQPLQPLVAKEVIDPSHPKRKVIAQVTIPEAERRHAQVSLVQPAHPLLPIAQTCMRDSDRDRPSSRDLCGLITCIKKSTKYTSSISSARCTLREKEIEIESYKSEIAQLRESIKEKESKVQETEHKWHETVEMLQEAREEIRGLTHPPQQQAKTQGVQERTHPPQPQARTQSVQERTRPPQQQARTQSVQDRTRPPQQQARTQSVQDRTRPPQQQARTQSVQDRTRPPQQQARTQSVQDRTRPPQQQARTQSVQDRTRPPQQQAQTSVQERTRPPQQQAQTSVQERTRPPQLQARTQSVQDRTDEPTQQEENIYQNTGKPPIRARHQSEKFTASTFGRKDIYDTPKSLKEIRELHWRHLHDCPINLQAGTSAVIGRKAYFQNRDSGAIMEFDSSMGRWQVLMPYPHLRQCSLVCLENKLTTVGGHDDQFNPSNKLYTFNDRQWIETLPPMPTERDSSAVVSTSASLIVAGGRNRFQAPLKIVEVLDVSTKQWSQAVPLPFPACRSSATIHYGSIYMTAGEGGYNHSSQSVIKCSLEALSARQDRPQKTVWQNVADLPTVGAALVEVSGRLLALGGTHQSDGVTDKPHKGTNVVYEYNTLGSKWAYAGHMTVSRHHCLAAVLPVNRLIVVGGVSVKDKHSKSAEFTTVRD